MVDSKYFGVPFGTSGDKATIPEATQPSGAVSYTQGWGPDYERDPDTDPLAKRVPRDETNEIYYQVTNALKYLQLYGTPEWYAVDGSGSPVSYPISARVRYNAGAGMQVWQSIVAANTSVPGADLTKWVVADGFSEASLAQALAATSANTTITPRRLGASVQRGAWNYATAGGTANALTATLTPALTANTAGTQVNLLISSDNTGAATFNAGPGALPIVTQKGAALQRGDLPANSIARLMCTGTAWMVTGGPAYSEVRIPLTANTTFYVRTDGNDNNDGFSNTAGSAFATLQGAYNAIRQRYFANGFSVTFQLGIAGSYVGLNHGTWPGTVIVRGDAANRPTYILTTIAGTESVVVASNGLRLEVLDVSLTSTPSTSCRGVWAQGGTILLSGIQFRSSGAGNVSAIFAENSGVVFAGGSIEIFDLTDLFFYGLTGARLYLGANTACTITLQNALTLARAFVTVSELALVTRRTCTFAGSGSTGQRYLASLNSVINTAGGGASYFPGTVAGAVSTGAQYA